MEKKGESAPGKKSWRIRLEEMDKLFLMDAVENAALSSAARKVVADIQEFGRMPKHNKGTSEVERAENKLAKRFADHQASIPSDVLRELQILLLGGAPDPAALAAVPPAKKRKPTPASSKSSGGGASQPASESTGGGASQPAAFSNTAQKLVEDIRKFGRMPK